MKERNSFTKIEKEVRMLERSPYGALWRGEKVLKSNIEIYTPFVMGVVRLLLDEGRIIGQPFLFPEKEGDILLWIPEVQK